MASKVNIGALRRGDIVRNSSSGEGYVVDVPFGASAIAVRTIGVTNPDEWVLIDPTTGQPRD